jgi:Porin PorA
MLKRTKLLLGSAGLLAVAALGVRFVAYPLLVRFPLNIDQSMVYTGQAKVYVNPVTGARLASPMTFPLTINRRVQVLNGNLQHAVVKETDAISFAGTTRTETYQYYMDRKAMHLENGSQSFAFGNPANVMQPNGSYRVNFPLSTDSSTYAAFAPQTDSMASAVPTGAAHREPASGVQVITFSTNLDHQVAPYYATYLTSTGMPASLSAASVAAELRVAGANVGQVASDVAPHLSPSQMGTLAHALAQPVPLTYSYFQVGQVSVAPKTGAVISAGSVREGVSVTPDLSAMAATRAVLAPYAGLPSVQALEKAVATLSAPQVVLQMTYTENPASVRAAAALSNQQADRISLVGWQVPVGLAGVAAILLVTAAVWRPRPHPGATPSEIKFGAEPGRKAA